jgi:hypothetical protein
VPSPGLDWQWQLGNAQTGQPTYMNDVMVYDSDAFETLAYSVAALHLMGARVVCYISVGSWESWRPDAASFPASVLGNAYAGSEARSFRVPRSVLLSLTRTSHGSMSSWPGERYLDVRSLSVLEPIMQ